MEFKTLTFGKNVGTVRTLFVLTIVFMVSAIYVMTKYSFYKEATTSNTTLKRIFLQRQKELEHNNNSKPFSFHDTLRSYHLQQKKTILFWNVPFNDFSIVLEFVQGEASVLSDETYKINSPTCGHCILTYDRTELSKSSAIVFHAPQVGSEDLPPVKTRKPNQLYVWWFQESSGNADLYMESRYMYYFFNQSMTVRRSSGVYSPYSSFPLILKMLWNKRRGKDPIQAYGKGKGVLLTSEENLSYALKHLPRESLTKRFSEISTTIPKEIQSLLKKKTRMTAWIVSNCDAMIRFQYFEKLENAGLEVDLYGNCGQPFPIDSRWDPAFYEVLSRYKFYLAMENSYHCQDYITEKLWYNALYSGVIPVIYGPHKDDVAAVLPPKSYIHVDDFSNHTALVKYLQYLDRNVTAYAEYLEWRSWIRYLDKHGEFQPENLREMVERGVIVPKRVSKLMIKYAVRKPNGFCGLCRKIHEETIAHNVEYSPMEWYGKDRRECHEEYLAYEMSKL